MQQADVSYQFADITEVESKKARLPIVNGFIGGDINFGRTIDPVTNEFSTEARLSNSLSVFSSVTLYNGNRISNTIRQSGFDKSAARADKENVETQIALQIAEAYLQILFAEEQLANAHKRLEQTQNQLDQTDKLIKAGTLPRADRLEILANIARDEQAIVTEENNVAIGYLNLKQLMTLDPDYDLSVERPTIIIPKSIDPDNFVLRNIYNKAYNNQPIIKAGNIRLKSAELQVDIAHALGLPSVSLAANLNSFWSDKTLDFANPTSTREIWVGNQARIDGGDIQVIEFRQLESDYSKRSYFGQISDNFGQGIGIDVNIPIFNANRTDIAVQRAQLGILNQKISNAQNEQQLKTDIQRAIANARAAKKQYEAADKTVNALKEAYKNTEKRFQLGAINTFEYTTSKNTLDQAEVDLIIAKYNYLYTLKVVDFYEGNKITLK